MEAELIVGEDKLSVNLTALPLLSAEKKRLEDELSKARVFQRSMLPPPRWERDGLRIDALYASCNELGGDLYDYEIDEQGRMAVIVADVSGHGVSAAMLTGIVKLAFHGGRGDGHGPGDVVRRIAAAMRAFDPAMFVTCICLRVCPRTRQLEYANAGHPAGWLWGADRDATPLADTGPMISAAWPDEALWETRAIALRAGDRALLYTDGLETVTVEGESFGRDRIMEVVRSNPDGGTRQLQALIGAARQFAGSAGFADDISMVALSVV